MANQPRSRIILRKRIHNCHGFHTHTHNLPNEADDVVGVVFAVGVGFDAAAFVFGDLVLVDDPIDGGAVAEAVEEDFGGMPTRVSESLTTRFFLSGLRRIFWTR